MVRPVDNTFPEWASDLTNVVEPAQGQKDTGWVLDQVPPSQTENWIQNTTFNWVEYYDSTINGFASKQNSPPDLSVVISSGILRYGQDDNLIVPEQTSVAFTAPITFPKIVGTFVNNKTGALLNAEGSEGVVPVAPPIPDGHFPIYLSELSVAQTQIFNDDITEFRQNKETLAAEIYEAIEDSNQTPDPLDPSQLSRAIGNLSASSTQVITSGHPVQLSDSGRLLACDTTLGSFGVMLQSALLSGDRFSLIVKKISNDSDTVTISAPGSDTIDRTDSIIIKSQNQAVEIRCDGVDSFFISNTFNNEYSNILVGGNISTNLFQSGLSTTNATTPPNDNNVYVADQWVLQSDGNDTVNVSRSGASLLTSTVVTVNRKWGFIIPIEGEIYRRLGGFSCSIACEIQNTSGTISNARIALLSSGPAATTDVVASWNVSGVDPTLNAPWTYQNTPVDNPINTSEPGLITAENIQVSANAPAIGAVFIWVDDDDASVADSIAIRRAALVKSPVFTFFAEENVQDIIAQYRYYQKSYNDFITPGTITDIGRYTYMHPTNTDELNGLVMHTSISLRATPTVTFFSPVTGDSGVVAGENDVNRPVSSVDGTGHKSSGRPSVSGPQTNEDTYKAHITLNSRI